MSLETTNTNSLIHDYLMSSYRPNNNDSTFRGIIENNYINYNDGIGLNTNFIDIDSDIKNNIKITHDGSKNQMNIRSFQAAPDLSRGMTSPEMEQILISGEDTTLGCKLKEVAYFKYPANENTLHYINGTNSALKKWSNNRSIGQSSKDIYLKMKNGEF